MVISRESVIEREWKKKSRDPQLTPEQRFEALREWSKFAERRIKKNDALAARERRAKKTEKKDFGI